MIELRGVTKRFGDGATSVRAVDGLSFVCPRGSFWALMGPSGSGKSTVLHLIAGLTRPSEGNVLVEGVDVARMSANQAAALRRRTVGYVMQAFNLLPYLTVQQNIAVPLMLEGLTHEEIASRVDESLALVNLAHRAAHRPSELSGGEQQRVAIARALVIRPAILLADEPTGNLDRTTGRAIMDLIQDVNEATRVTVLMVTHDPVFATCAQRVLRLVDGRLSQEIALPDEHASDGDPRQGWESH